jgi:hypothetical protein
MTALAQYFSSPYYEEALESYAKFAGEYKWEITHKLDMYNLAKKAFEIPLPEDEKRQVFSEIYSNLKNHWGVFRNAQCSVCMQELSNG